MERDEDRKEPDGTGATPFGEPGAVLAPDTVLYWASPLLDPAACRIAVTIPTFRRPGPLVETLASIAPQIGTHQAAFVIMENEAEGREGAKAAMEFLSRNSLPGIILVVIAQGNCNAYNGGWRVVRDHLPNAAFVAVCDDDETAAPGWLDQLVATQKQTGADITGGPQAPRLPNGFNGPAHPVFRPPYSETGPVAILYSSGNLLMARGVIETMPEPFLDPAFNFTGGGDSDFFVRARTKGFRFAWANDAVLHEAIPARRMERDWLKARALRNGALSAIIERREHGATLLGRARVFAKSLALLVASPLRAAGDLARSGSWVDARYRMEIGLGRMMGEMGLIKEQYRNPEKN
jgi:GT2 family glycosyltransferase